MRRIYLVWVIAVFGIVGTTYGAYSLIYAFNHGKDFPVYGLLLLILGLLALITFLSIYIASYISNKKKKNEPVIPSEDNNVEEEEVESISNEETIAPPLDSEPRPKNEDRDEYVPRSTNNSYRSSSSYSVSTIYVKQVGYGPLLRIEGGRVVDMRTNTYYRIENNMVMQDGYGPVFEIRGNQIKDAFGGYLYELSGSNINKVFGGFYASISGNYITLYDSSIKYEMTDSLSKRQILVVAALLFGKY